MQQVEQTDMERMLALYRKQGFFHHAGMISSTEVSSLLDALATVAQEANRYGIRGLMALVPAIHALANAGPLPAIAREVLGEQARPVRSVYFDKLPGANWNVAWHQDTSIAVDGCADLPGFGRYSLKQGVGHVEPPEDYLANMLTLRLHLDPAGSDNGPLRVISGSHRDGRITSAEVLAQAERGRVHECIASAGDVLLMSPLLLHSSRKAKRPGHRRIVHIEYSAMDLPAPLRWHEQR
jgi:hypothetical protein